MSRSRAHVVEDPITGSICLVRGQRAMLDGDLAVLYGVSTKALLQAVRRNRRRFPVDFMFQLGLADLRARDLRSQTVTSSHGGRRYLPYAFTEQGVAMLSSVLRSPRAIAVNIEIMRAFVRLRLGLASYAQLGHRLDGLEQHYDGQFRVVFRAIRQLVAPPHPPRRRMGFRPRDV